MDLIKYCNKLKKTDDVYINKEPYFPKSAELKRRNGWI